MSCVSIGLAVDNKVVVAVVYHPATDELFQAIRGLGAYLNGKPIRVSQAKSIKESLVVSLKWLFLHARINLMLCKAHRDWLATCT